MPMRFMVVDDEVMCVRRGDRVKYMTKKLDG